MNYTENRNVFGIFLKFFYFFETFLNKCVDKVITIVYNSVTRLRKLTEMKGSIKMTNATIILNESIKLMEQGVLKGTGEFVKFQDVNGEVKEVEIPEEIHTFNGWKQRGYSVKKGEKSNIKFSIWKCSSKTVENENGDDEEITTNMFMKLSAFFTLAQVEKVGA